MSTQTTNYNLTKPDATDFYDIGVFNQNADITDGALHSIAASAQGALDAIALLGKSYCNAPLGGADNAESITINDALAMPFRRLAIYGITTLSGTPSAAEKTPCTLSPLTNPTLSVGDASATLSGVSLYGLLPPYCDKIEFDGEAWYSVRRVKRFVWDSSKTIYSVENAAANTVKIMIDIPSSEASCEFIGYSGRMSNYFTHNVNVSLTTNSRNGVNSNARFIYINAPASWGSDVAAVKETLDNLEVPFEFLYPLKNPSRERIEDDALLALLAPLENASNCTVGGSGKIGVSYVRDINAVLLNIETLISSLI